VLLPHFFFRRTALSHIVTIQTRVTDPTAITAACRRLQLAEPVAGTAQLYGGEASGLLVQLPGWQYPVVIDTATGTARFDNYNGHWGSQVELDKLLQMYAVEKIRLESRAKGFTVTEQPLADGSIKLQVLEGA